MGLTPHREANAASEWRRSGLLPEAMRRVAAVSGPIPKPSTRAGAVIRVSRWISASSSPSEDYLTVLAGQRQWIAATNFAGCPGRPPDSFANSAVLNYLGKVPDALGWPIDPCFPVQIDPKAEQFEQVVAGAYQRPFAVHLLQSPQQELPESPALLDLAEYRLHSLHPQSVALPTPPGL